MKKIKQSKNPKPERLACPRNVSCSNGICKTDDSFKKLLYAKKVAQNEKPIN